MSPMRLEELLRGAGVVAVSGRTDLDITQVAYDSRKVTQGAVFVPLPGLHADGRSFVSEALSAGATAVVVDRDVPVAGATRVLVEDARKALAMMSCEFYGNPSHRLRVVGITGTNGKTTVSYLVQSVCGKAGFSAGVIGTIGYDLGDLKLKGPHTTPEAVEFQELLAKMLEQGMTHAAVEVSSHGLALRRTFGTEFDVVVFTNLSRDHLDFHGSFEEYRDSKLKLFSRAERGADQKRPAAVLNADDPSFHSFLKASGEGAITYSVREEADVRASDIELSRDGSRFKILWRGGASRVRLSLPGMFNVSNALAAFGAAVCLGFGEREVLRGLEALGGVRGRMEPVCEGQGFSVFVDYAHTPDALSNVLKAARQITERELICVFGCGGDRDRGKRSEMGQVSGTLADYTIITSDNPRSEDPLAIIAEIEEGARSASARYSVVPDRREAIQKALECARDGDSVVVAGKGHEDYQIVGSEVRHFDDREVVQELLATPRKGTSGHC